MKSKKSIRRCQNDPNAKGYGRLFGKNLGLVAKKIWGQKRSLLDSNHVSHFEVDIEKRIFGPFSRKNGCFSVIRVRDGSVLILGHFLGDPDDPKKFHLSPENQVIWSYLRMGYL